MLNFIFFSFSFVQTDTILQLILMGMCYFIQISNQRYEKPSNLFLYTVGALSEIQKNLRSAERTRQLENNSKDFSVVGVSRKSMVHVWLLPNLLQSAQRPALILNLVINKIKICIFYTHVFVCERNVLVYLLI